MHPHTRRLIGLAWSLCTLGSTPEARGNPVAAVELQSSPGPERSAGGISAPDYALSMRGPYPDLATYCAIWEEQIRQPVKAWQAAHADREAPRPPHCDPAPTGARADEDRIELKTASPPFLDARLFSSTGYEYPFLKPKSPQRSDEPNLYPYLNLAVRTRAGWYVAEGILEEEEFSYDGCGREGDAIIFQLGTTGKGAQMRLALRLFQGRKRFRIVSCSVGADGAPRCMGKRLSTMMF